MENSVNKKINFISSKDSGEEPVMHSKSDNIEFMVYDNAHEVIEELFESLLNRCQKELETSIRSSDFISNCIHLMYYKLHKINRN